MSDPAMLIYTSGTSCLPCTPEPKRTCFEFAAPDREGGHSTQHGCMIQGSLRDPELGS